MPGADDRFLPGFLMILSRVTTTVQTTTVVFGRERKRSEDDSEDSGDGFTFVK